MTWSTRAVLSASRSVSGFAISFLDSGRPILHRYVIEVEPPTGGCITGGPLDEH
jgi:hypothetical protein